MREKSDARTTSMKIAWLKTELEPLLHDGGDRSSQIISVLDMIEEEVEVMAKCQYEMRKTIKSKTYIVADNQPFENES